jgi:hypothetical protein
LIKRKMYWTVQIKIYKRDGRMDIRCAGHLILAREESGDIIVPHMVQRKMHRKSQSGSGVFLLSGGVLKKEWL